MNDTKATGADEWAVGDYAAELSSYAYESQVTLTTVERITATQIVLATGSRYRRDTGRQVGAQSAWERSTDLCRLDDPRVVTARVQAATRRLLRAVDQAARSGRLQTVDDCTALLSTVNEALTMTRKKIAKLIGQEVVPDVD